VGGTERVEWHWESTAIAATETLVPTGFAAWNDRLNLRNTFY
jgi:hypothetical protein